MDFENYIRSHEDFPKPGVQFWDFVPLLASPIAFKEAINKIREHYQEQNISHIIAIEAKGFTLGAALAYAMELPLMLIRKPGLIPGNVAKATFIKEYGNGEYQLKTDSLPPNSRVLIVYDILAGSGASQAAIELIEQQAAIVAGCAYVIELEYLAGRQSLQNYNLFSLVKIANNHTARKTA